MRLICGASFVLLVASAFVGCAAILEVHEDPVVRSADGGAPSEASTSDSAPKRRRVFVTKNRYNADLEGLAPATSGSGGADVLCTQAANGASLGGGPWIAWIRDDDQRVEANRLLSAGPWYLVDEKTEIFENQIKLRALNSTPRSALDMDEGGGRVASTERVWTGSRRGLACGTCGGFSVASAESGGGYGRVGALSNAWTDEGCLPCNGEAHLYCFEQ